MLDSNHSHRELVELPGLGRAFVRIEDSCGHVFEDEVFLTAKGNSVKVKDHMCPTRESTIEYIEQMLEKKNDSITGGSTCCIKCGKVWMPDFKMMWDE